MRFLPALLVASLLSASFTAFAETPAVSTEADVPGAETAVPGEGLALQGDHPSSYVVQPGDTLWAIAGKFLKDPARWRELWRGSQRPGDPNRIFPGDVLTLVWQEGKPALVLTGETGATSTEAEALSGTGTREAVAAHDTAPTAAATQSPAEAEPATAGEDDAIIPPWTYMDTAAAAGTDKPDLTPPAIDAWFDISFTDSDFNALGFNETAGGYRFIAGFHLENFGNNRFGFAPEVGYFRLGSIEEKTSVTVSNPPNFQGYIQTTTHTNSLDTSSLDFGVRVNVMIASRLDVFLRTGLGFYHASTEAQDSFSYTPITPGGPAIPSTQGTTSSSTETGTAPYAALGLTIKLGTVPSLYGEYGKRIIDGENISTIAVGFLLNF